MRNQLQERLSDCREHLLNEQRSAKPSVLYISDLKETIQELEIRLDAMKLHGIAPFQMVK